MSRPFLEVGDDLELRRLDPPDAEVLQVIIEADRDRLKRFMWWAETSTIDTTRTFVEAAVTDDRLDPLGIVVDGQLVGVVGADADAITGNYAIGYWIGTSHEGRGYVTRACSALIDYLFSTLGTHRISIKAAPENPRSRAIPERLGFFREGVERGGGRGSTGYHDLVVYSMLENEWRAS